jgi:hypothetical protein
MAESLSDAAHRASSLIIIFNITGSRCQCSKHFGFQHHKLVGIRQQRKISLVVFTYFEVADYSVCV